MRKHIIVLLLSCLINPAALAQFEGRMYTRPEVPPKDVLDRLSLTLAWSGKIRTAGLKDGIATLQIMGPANNKSNAHLLIQTIGGDIVQYDAENGDRLWRTPVRIPFESILPITYNPDTVFVFRGNYMFGLDRTTGKHRFYTVDYLQTAERTTLRPPLNVKLGYRLIFPPTSPPVADDLAVFIPSGPRIAAYLTPFPKPKDKKLYTVPAINPASAFPPDVLELEKLNPPALKFIWSKRFLDFNIATQPVISEKAITIPGTNGVLLTHDKFNGDQRKRYKVFGKLSAALGHFGNQVFIGTEETLLYAFDVQDRRLQWRYFSGGRIKKPVHVTYEDVFITPEKAGLSRLDRKTGRSLWRNRDANMFLAVNQKFVYARDSRGNLLVIDYMRGRTLAKLNTRAFTITLPHTYTDRIYMAAHNGRIMCLRLTENETPVLPRFDPEAEKKKTKKKKNGDDLPPIN
ncbi:MAG: PQQ-binding-like beta-propeller repeat protein [Gemmataceae bacterium]